MVLVDELPHPAPYQDSEIYTIPRVESPVTTMSGSTTIFSLNEHGHLQSRPTHRAEEEFGRALLQDIDQLIYLCKDPVVEEYIGTTFFGGYSCKDPVDLAQFLRAINVHPPLARYVFLVFLDEDIDGPTKSGIYQMLLDVANEEDTEQNPISPALRTIADDFFLISMGDAEDVPDHVYFSLLGQLFAVVTNLEIVSMPSSWKEHSDEIFPSHPLIITD
ncbi:hypothetical protein K491DRAFT_329591 [Lophiostoma macrostomum CBS 122681]|uniref:Uncharacterized protein n=1 Tax=Lophiostoma macrostomum CBS 122681 TaxID=1314788 RepID=A0A6A6TBH3_9PLEO|nr:hypothetical protein K491DRAFT_329591 [Lophiostoma macrostomum CBS 122681]